jgi:hypothetical protein
MVKTGTFWIVSELEFRLRIYGACLFCNPSFFEARSKLLWNPAEGIIVLGQDTCRVGTKHYFLMIAGLCCWISCIGEGLILRLFHISRYWERVWVSTMDGGTQNSQKTLCSPFGNRGFFKAWLILKQKIFITELKVWENIICENKQQITKGNKSQVKSEVLWYCWVS